MNVALLILFWVSVALVLFTTVSPLTGSVQWWVRGWDFPRVHIMVVAIATAALGVYLGGPAALAACAVLATCAFYQGYRVFPYTAFAATEIPLSNDVPAQDRISIISATVLMENTDHAALRQLIDREDPDILLLMETDAKWNAALTEQLARYDTVVTHPLVNHYGMIFATKLKAIKAETVFLVDDETPTALAELEGPTGRFLFVGLHPRPPVPGTNTEERDAQIKRAALLADRTYLPVIAMGDFNDVAWSWTSERFKRYGEFRDPRAGRGMMPSFDANSWYLRFPIDQFYLTEGFDLISFETLEAFGSDHFPIKAVISVHAQP